MEKPAAPHGVSKSSSSVGTIQDLENAETTLPFRPVPAAADLVNSGLSLT